MLSATDLQLRQGETTDQYNARIVAARAVDNPEQAAKDEAAKQFGYDSADSFLRDAFQKPSQTTEQFYKSAYDAAGLGTLSNELAAKKQALTDAEARINDNPWLSEASRLGRTARTRELLGATIKNLQEEYDLKHGSVKELVDRHATDMTNDQNLRTARFNYLEKRATEAATAKKDQLAESKPFSVGSLTYQWDPTSKAFKAIGSNPTQTERQTAGVKAALKKARPALEATKGAVDHYVDPVRYMELRSDFAAQIGDVSDFDNVFAPLLSPAERARLGVGKAVGEKASPSGRSID